MTHYEVRCENCNVSAPPGARSCIHCGGRMRKPGELRSLELSTLSDPAELPPLPGEPAASGNVGEEAGLRRSPMRIATTALWVVVILVTLLRSMCSGG